MPDLARLARRRWCRIVVCICLGLLPLATAAAAEDVLGGLVGHWRGAITESSFEGGPDEVEVTIATAGSGVEVRWRMVDGGMAEIRLEPTARPEVLAPPAQGGLRAMLGGGSPPNPLEGEPLVWGRRDEHGLYIYRLEIAADGGLTLDRYGLEPDAGTGGLRYTVDRVGPGGGVEAGLRAVLAREGR